MAAGVTLTHQRAPVCVCGWRGTKRATTRQVGFHQWTGSCDCGRFVMGCVCVWSQFAHGGKKKCAVCVCLSSSLCLCVRLLRSGSGRSSSLTRDGAGDGDDTEGASGDRRTVPL